MSSLPILSVPGTADTELAQGLLVHRFTKALVCVFSMLKEMFMSHIDVHLDHNKWQSEHAFWLDELKVWKSEHRLALAASKDLELAFARFQQELEDFERHVFDHETQISVHEGVMAQAEKPGGVDIGAAGMEAMHDREIAVHASQATVFNRVRKRHQEFMKGIRLIERVIEKMNA